MLDKSLLEYLEKVKALGQFPPEGELRQALRVAGWNPEEIEESISFLKAGRPTEPKSTPKPDAPVSSATTISPTAASPVAASPAASVVQIQSSVSAMAAPAGRQESPARPAPFPPAPIIEQKFSATETSTIQPFRGMPQMGSSGFGSQGSFKVESRAAGNQSQSPSVSTGTPVNLIPKISQQPPVESVTVAADDGRRWFRILLPIVIIVFLIVAALVYARLAGIWFFAPEPSVPEEAMQSSDFNNVGDDIGQEMSNQPPAESPEAMIGANSTSTPITADTEENLRFDTDRDGLPDTSEGLIGTNKSRKDTDNDGVSDLEEIILGTDPLVPDETN